MGKIIFEDFSEQTEFMGGYYLPEEDEIHIDSSLSVDRQAEILIHEVLESCMHHQFQHSYIEILTTKIYLALKILKERDNVLK